MSDFNTTRNWVDTNLATVTALTDVTPAMLQELQVMADEENETLSGRAFNTLKNYHRQDGMRALGSIRLNSHDPRLDEYMDNAFSIVLLKADPHGTDGIFVIVQIVPERYVLKTIIRADRDYVTTGITHTYMSLFDSSLTKPFMITGTHNGECQKNIFIDKLKHDTYKNIDPQLPAGNNDVFTYVQPDGTVVTP